MIDLNYVFLFIAVVSPLVVLGRTWRSGMGHRGWRIAALVVLAVTGAAWILFPAQAGYIGAGVWFVLLFLPTAGLKRMSELTVAQQYRSARRLASLLQILHPSPELRHQTEVLRTLEARQAAGFVRVPGIRSVRPAGAGFRSVLKAPAVAALILLNLIAYGIEARLGSWSAPGVLSRLGALEPYAVLIDGQYWRLFTALFLHAGPPHLLFNLFALYILGPPLEENIGSIRFLLCYLISGIGSSAGVVALWRFGLNHTNELVGASGCIMGVVGAWAAFLVLRRHVPETKRRLANILLIVVIQTVFDRLTPQVSMSAHLCGLVTGFLVGLMLGSSRYHAPSSI
jgi:membrane associated rhomboid family serine protease